ncbi:Uncharacterised protein [[Clostridium] sordellii]|nr:Uncharacterised protein [[Clostridium] sordellii] [Paeniclostridium sordellii]
MTNNLKINKSALYMINEFMIELSKISKND